MEPQTRCQISSYMKAYIRYYLSAEIIASAMVNRCVTSWPDTIEDKGHVDTIYLVVHDMSENIKYRWSIIREINGKLGIRRNIR